MLTDGIHTSDQTQRKSPCKFSRSFLPYFPAVLSHDNVVVCAFESILCLLIPACEGRAVSLRDSPSVEDIEESHFDSLRSDSREQGTKCLSPTVVVRVPHVMIPECLESCCLGTATATRLQRIVHFFLSHSHLFPCRSKSCVVSSNHRQRRWRRLDRPSRVPPGPAPTRADVSSGMTHPTALTCRVPRK
jgi:hypothetical protein